MVENKELGRRVEKFCWQRGMSYQKLAEQADISVAALYKILSGNANPRLSTLRLICQALDISLQQLFSSGQSEETVTVMELETMIKDLNEDEKQMLKMYLELLNKR